MGPHSPQLCIEPFLYSTGMVRAQADQVTMATWSSTLNIKHPMVPILPKAGGSMFGSAEVFGWLEPEHSTLSVVRPSHLAQFLPHSPQVTPLTSIQNSAPPAAPSPHLST